MIQQLKFQIYLDEYLLNIGSDKKVYVAFCYVLYSIDIFFGWFVDNNVDNSNNDLFK